MEPFRELLRDRKETRRGGTQYDEKEKNNMTKKLTTALRASSLGMAALFTLLFTVPSAFGADIVKGDVPFAFHVRGKTLPTGNYQFDIDREKQLVTILGPKGSDAVMPFITLLAATPHSNSTDARIVFDKIGETYTLSELWAPDEAGVLLHATREKHEHHVLHFPHLKR
jgi:hypothetical protein